MAISVLVGLLLKNLGSCVESLFFMESVMQLKKLSKLVFSLGLVGLVAVGLDVDEADGCDSFSFSTANDFSIFIFEVKIPTTINIEKIHRMRKPFSFSIKQSVENTQWFFVFCFYRVLIILYQNY
jgi:hypothetical protein